MTKSVDEKKTWCDVCGELVTDKTSRLNQKLIKPVTAVPTEDGNDIDICYLCMKKITIKFLKDNL